MAKPKHGTTEWDKMVEENNKRDREFARSELQQVVSQLKVASEILEGCLSGGSFTIGDLATARKIILSTVRNNLDPYACGHMPDERRY